MTQQDQLEVVRLVAHRLLDANRHLTAISVGNGDLLNPDAARWWLHVVNNGQVPHPIVAAAHVLAGLPVPPRDPAEVERERLIQAATAATAAIVGDHGDPLAKTFAIRLVDAGWRPTTPESEDR